MTLSWNIIMPNLTPVFITKCDKAPQQQKLLYGIHEDLVPFFNDHWNVYFFSP